MKLLSISNDLFFYKVFPYLSITDIINLISLNKSFYLIIEKYIYQKYKLSLKEFYITICRSCLILDNISYDFKGYCSLCINDNTCSGCYNVALKNNYTGLSTGLKNNYCSFYCCFKCKFCNKKEHISRTRSSSKNMNDSFLNPWYIYNDIFSLFKLRNKSNFIYNYKDLICCYKCYEDLTYKEQRKYIEKFNI
jgi:hypothetical protein